MWRSTFEDGDGPAESPNELQSCAVFEGHKHDVYSVISREGGGALSVLVTIVWSVSGMYPPKDRYRRFQARLPR